MPVLKALKKFTYAREKLRPGDLFKCKERFVPLLVGRGIATRPDAPTNEELVARAETAQTYSTRHMEAETPKVEEKKPLGEMTVAELRAEAEAKDIHLPAGYIAKAELLSIVENG